MFDSAEITHTLIEWKRRSKPGLLFVGLVYFLLIFILNVFRFYDNYNFHDLYIFENSFWNTLRGRFFWNFYEFGNHLGVHFSPGLIIPLIFYSIVQHPLTLIFVQTLAITFSVLVVYALSERVISDAPASFLFSIAYLLYPATIGTAFSGFHEAPFVILPIFLLFLAIESEKERLFWVTFAFCLIWKETYALIFLFFGLALVFNAKTRRKGWLLMIFSFMWLIWTLFIIMPLIRGTPFSEGVMKYRFPVEIGHTPIEIISNFFKNPGIFFEHAFQKEKIFYILKLIIPLALIPILSPLLLLPVLPQLAQNLLSRHMFGISLMKHYSAPMIPFLFYAFIKSAGKLAPVASKWKIRPAILLRITGWLIIFLCIITIFNSGLFPRIFLGKRSPAEQIHELTEEELKIARDMGVQVPEDASLAVSGHLAKYFARRKVISYVNRGFLELYPFDYILYFPRSPRHDLLQRYPSLKKMINEHYDILDQRRGFFLYKRREGAPMNADQRQILEAVPE